MTDARSTLVLLQQADSFFPSGGLSFSWGLERLAADGVIRTQEEVARFLEHQLRYRWATSDRVALIASYRATRDLKRVADVDAVVEAAALPALIRDGSRRAGAAILSVHRRLGTDQAAAYQELVNAGHAHGHLPVVQGLLWRGLGLDETQSSVASAYGFAVAVVSAALRLGLIGHLSAQRNLTGATAIIAALLDKPAAPLSELGSYAPFADIATMRQETAEPRLFAN